MNCLNNLDLIPMTGVASPYRHINYIIDNSSATVEHTSRTNIAPILFDLSIKNVIKGTLVIEQSIL
jgi:hypothetical protein